MRQTTNLKKENTEKKWFVIDADSKILGKLAVRAAEILSGRTKTNFTLNVDNGDNVIVINTDKIVLSSDKLDKKLYYNHSGYAGGLRKRTARTMKKSYSPEMVERAIKGMLTRNKMGRKQLRSLFLYKGSEHKHSAQQPERIDF